MVVDHLVVGPEQAHGAGREGGHVAAAHVVVAHHHLAHHLGKQVVEVGAVRHVGQEGGVLFLGGGPVQAVHVGVVEVVALQAPHLVKHLGPLVARVDVGIQAREGDFAIGGGGLAGRLHNAVGVVGGHVEHFFAVGAQGVVVQLGHKHLVLPLLHVEAVQALGGLGGRGRRGRPARAGGHGFQVK